MNYMNLNTYKPHLLISGYMRAKFDQDRVWESNDVKPLGVTIDNKQSKI